MSNGTYAPLSRPLFVYVNSSSVQNNPKVIDFMEFYLEEVSSLLKDVGYVPLTEEEYKRERKKFSNFVEQNKAE